MEGSAKEEITKEVSAKEKSIKEEPQQNVTEKWYKNGLRFSCTQCGACCTGSPGFVWVSDQEIEDIASYLDIDVLVFQRKYIRIVWGRKALIEMRKNYDCVFLKEGKCSVYHVRPQQCRTFPWWVENLKSPEAWQEAARHCEGISQDAPLVSIEKISQIIP